MSSIDFRTRFLESYKGDIRDPILTTLLETIDVYQENIKSQHLLTTYAQRSDQISDGLFEVLRRHLFGQMFPGPAFVVAQASLREVASASPLQLGPEHNFELHDQEGETLLFAPQHPAWITPATTNDVRVQTFGDDLMIGFSIIPERLSTVENGFASVSTGDTDPLLVERIRCRIPGIQEMPRRQSSVLRTAYPGKYNVTDDFFQTPFETRYLHIPYATLLTASRRGDDGIIWLPLQGLGSFAQQFDKKLVLNAFTMWNMVRQEAAPIPIDNFRYTMSITQHAKRETLIESVKDFGSSPPIEYVDSSLVMDPAYPFQYTSSSNIRRDEILFAFSPPPKGDIKVRYSQYSLGEDVINISSGRTFGLFQGIQERIKSVTSITPTQRLNALGDKVKIWDYFRSLIASRNRWLTKDDLRAALLTYPPFTGKYTIVVSDKVRFDEQVGRVNGFLTPFTEVTVPVRDRTLLSKADKPYFERELGLYLKQRTIHGNFLRVKLVLADDL